MKVLIVDDSLVIRNRISRMMTNRDKEVELLMAENGEVALDQYMSHQPDVVTMDLTMPNMNGIETIEAINRIDSDARILVVSALKDKATAIRAVKSGARGFIAKPFDDDDLWHALTHITMSEV